MKNKLSKVNYVPSSLAIQGSAVGVPAVSSSSEAKAQGQILNWGKQCYCWVNKAAFLANIYCVL